jgi:hypothetical protein
MPAASDTELRWWARVAGIDAVALLAAVDDVVALGAERPRVVAAVVRRLRLLVAERRGV